VACRVRRTTWRITNVSCSAIRRQAAPSLGSFHRGKQTIEIAVAGRVIMDDPSAAVAACIAAQGVFQSLDIGLDAWFASGELVHILPDWSSERYPVYAYHPSRHLPPAKVRPVLDFVVEIAP
jgi:DNA-binding transcriptional LysR family regulator